MSRIEEHPLPDGRSFTLETIDRRQLVAVVHDSGERELHLYGRNRNEPAASVRLEDDDARRLGALLAGTMFRQTLHPDIAARMGDVVLDWVRIDASSDVVGRSLLDIDLHRVTGMTVVAIVRDDVTIDAPDPSTVLLAGDRVVVVGQLRQMSRLVDLLVGD